MLRYLLQHNAITLIPIVVLLVFFTIIAAVLIWMYRPGSNSLYKSIAQSALKEGVVKNGK